jgi:hypothetical protein
VLRTASNLALGLWLGAALLTAFVVAPHAFGSFATRAEAGEFVGGILLAVYLGGLAAGLIALGVAVLEEHRRRLRAPLGGAVIAAAIVSLCLRAKLAAMRATLGPIDALDPADPGRRAFGAWHGVSMLVLLAGMIAALAAVLATYERGTSSVSGNRQP